MKNVLSIVAFVAFFLCLQGFCFFENERNTSKFTGTWVWVEDIDSVQSFTIFVGERNDSLLFSINGIFYCGNKIHGYNFDNNGNFIADVKISIPESNRAKSKISVFNSNFYSGSRDVNEYNPALFELLNDTTMLFILDDNKPYWPDTAIMRRRDYINHTFSQVEDCYLYRGK